MADPGCGNVIPCEQRTLELVGVSGWRPTRCWRSTPRWTPTPVVDRRRYYLGSISGKKVIVAMTGIDLVNATNTIDASSHALPVLLPLPLPPQDVLGVAGGAGRTSIGDVAIPARWTLTTGQHSVGSIPACWLLPRRFLLYWTTSTRSAILFVCAGTFRSSG